MKGLRLDLPVLTIHQLLVGFVSKDVAVERVQLRPFLQLFFLDDQMAQN